MLIVYKKYQNKWARIAQEFTKKSGNGIKNKFYSIFRRIKNKIVKNDFSFSNKLSLFETSYIIDLITNHYKNVASFPKKTGKRGKDYIYTLLQNIDMAKVTAYKERLEVLHKGKVILDELSIENENERKQNDKSIQDLKEILPFKLASVTKSFIQEKLCFVLPDLETTHNKKTLTSEEKEFIKLQVFQNKGTTISSVSASNDCLFCNSPSINSYTQVMELV